MTKSKKVERKVETDELKLGDPVCVREGINIQGAEPGKKGSVIKVEKWPTGNTSYMVDFGANLVISIYREALERC